MLKSLLNKIFHRATRRRYDGRLEHLLSPPRIQGMIQCERARVDRCGGSLSLITFTPLDGWKDQIILRMAQTSRERLRLTDFAGWLDDRRLAIVLPLTDAKGAWRVADDVMLSLPNHQRTPICRVYTYPSEWWSGDDGDRIATKQGEEQRVHPAESLLVQPLPPWKRIIDILFASLGLVLLSPIMLAVALAIRFSSSGPVFFSQERSGRGGKPFMMYKFRSMVVDAEERKKSLMELNEQDGPAFKITHDPRVTKLGHFLRSTSLDELPQLWNVVKGEMSLVGPRPLPVSESEACSTWQKRRLDVTPGITCIWQCQGGQRVTFDEWMRMDIRYVKSQSLMYDIGLILKTVFAVVSRKALKHA